MEEKKMHKIGIIKQTVALSLSAVMAMGTFTGCGSSATAGNDGTLTIHAGYLKQTAWNYSLIIAKEVGIWDEIFDGEDVDIEFTPFTGGPEVNEAFTAGKIDIEYGMGDQPFLTGLQNGVDASILAKTSGQEETMIFVASSDSDINSPADFKGKKIAVAIGTFTHKSLVGVLQSQGINVNDVELINFSTAGDVVTAITKGDVDVYLGSIFDLNEDIENGLVKQVGDITGYPANSYLVGMNSFIEEHPDLTEKIVEAAYEGAEYIRDNPDEVNSIIAESTGINEDNLNEFFPLVDTNVDFTDDDLQQIKSTEQFLLDNDFLDSEIPNLEENHINTTFIEKVKAGN
jgi:sulfonate transport system substrate-binding protein